MINTSLHNVAGIIFLIGVGVLLVPYLYWFYLNVNQIVLSKPVPEKKKKLSIVIVIFTIAAFVLFGIGALLFAI